MPSGKLELPAEEEFAVVDPETLREALYVFGLPPDGELPDKAGASVMVELTAIQARDLMVQGTQQLGLEGDAAIKGAVEALIGEHVGAGLFDLRSQATKWLGIIRASRS